MTEISLDGVTKRFGDVPVLDEISIDVHDGELLVVVGPSGCGKTTLLRILAGLETPTEGQVYFDGEDVTDVPARNREVALVFQDFALLPHLDVRENLGFNLRMRGADGIDDRVERTAALLDIEELLDRRVDELSGGQKQRVALGRAIACDAVAYLLDEPFANLDAPLRERMQTDLARLQRRFETTTIHVTHDQHEAMSMGDRLVVLNDGEVQQVGTPRDLYAEPATRFVAEFIGTPTMNFLDGTYDPEQSAVSVGCGDTSDPLSLSVSLPDADAGPVEVGVRPEDLVVGRDEWAAGLPATVDYIEYGGADAFVYLRATDLPEIVARVDGDSEISTGEDVRFRVPDDRVHLFDAGTGHRLERP